MIYFRDDAAAGDVDAGALVMTAGALLAAIGESNASLSLSLVRDDAMRQLNREHRGRDVPTDVLSFSIDGEAGRVASAGARPERMLGDVVISVDTARRQAAGYDATLQDELYRLLIHGVLHVVGHDHEERDERATMEREERRLADVIALPWPYETHR
ncbi:MAG: rRNA maturation RNase YbeY [Candidatus Eremiobacteraeota bacterium]|nr:rRNA maturation RNase YbeY [Candidatus Eremiobacteraeota bacterium]